MNKLILFSFLIIGAMCSGCFSEEWVLHSEKEYNIYYPKGWSVEKKDNILAFQSPNEHKNDYYKENMTIIVLHKPPHFKLADFFVELRRSAIKDYGYDAIVSSRFRDCNGKKSIEIISDIEVERDSLNEKIDITIHQVIFAQGERLCAFRFAAEKEKYDQYLETAYDIIDSFELKVID